MYQVRSLLIVYNNDSGMLQNFKQYSLSPSAVSSRGCNLAALTHSPVGMKKDWKRFVRELNIPSRFLDKNEFMAEFRGASTSYPCILLKDGGMLSVLVTTEEIGRCRELEDLMGLLRERIPQVPTPHI